MNMSTLIGILVLEGKKKVWSSVFLPIKATCFCQPKPFYDESICLSEMLTLPSCWVRLSVMNRSGNVLCPHKRSFVLHFFLLFLINCTLIKSTERREAVSPLKKKKSGSSRKSQFFLEYVGRGFKKDVGTNVEKFWNSVISFWLCRNGLVFSCQSHRTRHRLVFVQPFVKLASNP